MTTTSDFITKFRWTRDKRESWRILADSFEGDCDDFALTVLWLECGKSMWRFWWLLVTLQAVVGLCRLPDGQLHAVLWVRGKGWIDNVVPRWSSDAQHRRILPYPVPVVALKMLM